MKEKFYEDISNIDLRYLLEATPIHKDSRLNFSRRLTPDYFFENMFVESDLSKKSVDGEQNINFQNKINTKLSQMQNPHAKVDLIHIQGYAGCGKSTFVYHLMRKLDKDKGVDNIIDFDGERKVADTYIDRIAKKILKDIEQDHKILSSMQNLSKFQLRNFGDSVKVINTIVNSSLFCSKNTQKDEIEKLLSKFVEQKKSNNNSLLHLLIFDFLWSLVEQCCDNHNSNIYIVFDNLDSLSDLDEERNFVSTLKRFINACNYFFGANLENKNTFYGRTIENIIASKKLVCFLTTRIITNEVIKEIEPALDKVFGWFSVQMPENYYNHLNILNKRIEHYLKLESDNTDDKVNELEYLKTISNIFYKNQLFRKLFNGNYRYCVECLHYIASNDLFKRLNLIEECKKLSETEFADGAVGIMLSMVLQYLKTNEIYNYKLHLQDNKNIMQIGLSRIILTIIREHGGRCSLLTIFNCLSKLYSVDEICQTTYDLSEACRDVWRRLIVFYEKCPHSVEDIKCQGKLFEEGKIDESYYSGIYLSVSGYAYIESVVPHFEFILSRHAQNNSFLYKTYQPLYSLSSEKTFVKNGQKTYGFEHKIDLVFSDVRKKCEKSQTAYKTLMRKYKIAEEDFMNTVYNYLNSNLDGSLYEKQSYESRLIFSHIGYIDRYRRYLLKKMREFEERDVLQDINYRLVQYIKKYLNLYLSGVQFHASQQDLAATKLGECIDVIVASNYFDFEQKIEI